jgi:hypothetical protein
MDFSILEHEARSLLSGNCMLSALIVQHDAKSIEQLVLSSPVHVPIKLRGRVACCWFLLWIS